MHLGAALWLAPVGVAAAEADPAPRLAEAQLLHRRLDLGGLRLVDNMPVAALPQIPVLVVHLWALECKPCLGELPWLVRIARGYTSEPAVRFLFISESGDRERWLRHLRGLGIEGARLLLGQTEDERLRVALQDRTQPITLLVDGHRVVRQAFVGSLEHRRRELTLAIDRLTAPR